MRMWKTMSMVFGVACSHSSKDPEEKTTPTINSLSISPEEGITTSSELLCSATARDEDNDPLSFSYQWTTVAGTILSDTRELRLSPDLVQPTFELTCTVTVTDGENNVQEHMSVIVENTDPTVSHVSIAPEQVFVHSVLECFFDSADADQEELTVSYSWSQNGTEVGTESALQLNAENFSDDDVIVCTVTVEDGYEGTASDSAEVVIGNTAPEIGSITINPDPSYSHNTLICTANDIIDLDLDEVSISYEWSMDGEVQTEISNMLSGPFLVGSTISCRATPNDGKVDGVAVESSIIISNTAPTLDALSLSPMVNIEANTFLVCEATVSDVDNEELIITYAWNTSDGTILGTESALQLDATMVSPGESLVCTATVIDPHGASDSLGQSLSIINTNPVLDSATEIIGDATTTSTLTCAAAFSDLNDGALYPTFSWTNSSGIELNTAQSYTIAAAETETGDELTCTASVEDANGATLSSSATVTIANTLPSVTGVTLSPNPVISTDSLICSVDSTTDIDEDAVTVLYEWSVDGVLQSETSPMLPGPLLVGTLISCIATPNDGKENGPSDTADVTVENTPPSVDTVSLDVAPIFTDGTITATVTLSDIDAEQTVTANYAWHVMDASDGGIDTEVQTGAERTLDGLLFDKDDHVYVIVTPYDGVEYGVPVESNQILISNSVPSSASISISAAHNPAVEGSDDLLCSLDAESSDADEDSISYTYTWTDPSGAIQQTTETTETMDVFLGSGTSVGAWMCTVQPSDGTDSGSASSASFDVERVYGSQRVILSAGSLEHCWRYDPSRCSLQDIVVDIDAETIIDNGTIANTMGAISPSISPDGMRLVYDSTASIGGVTVNVLDFTSGARMYMGVGNKPSWMNNETVMYGTDNLSDGLEESTRWIDVAKQSVPETASLSGQNVAGTPVIRILGADNTETGFDSYDCNGEDPYPLAGRPGWVATHSVPWRFPNPPNGSFEPHTCPWLLGLNPYSDLKDPRAVVFDSNATSWEEGVSWEYVDVDSVGITGCAHLAISPSGNRLLCTNQPTVTYLTDPVDGTVTERNDMYGFHYDAGVWVPDRGTEPMFEHPLPKGLEDAELIWQTGLSCHVMRVKQGSFCGHDDIIAADIYCEDTTISASSPQAVYARVVLIDIQDPENPRIIDLTSKLEDARGIPRGGLGGYTLACSAVP